MPSLHCPTPFSVPQLFFMFLISPEVYLASSSHSSSVWLRKQSRKEIACYFPGAAVTDCCCLAYLIYFRLALFSISYVRVWIQSPIAMDYFVFLEGLSRQGNWFFPSVLWLGDNNEVLHPAHERHWQTEGSPVEGHWDDQELGQTYRRKHSDLIKPGETKAKWGHNFSLPQCKVGLQRIKGQILPGGGQWKGKKKWTQAIIWEILI